MFLSSNRFPKCILATLWRSVESGLSERYLGVLSVSTTELFAAIIMFTMSSTLMLTWVPDLALLYTLDKEAQ